MTIYVDIKLMDTLTKLSFRPVTIDAVPALREILRKAESRTCDYTIAGLLMWSDYFHYQYDIVDNTLFIKGVSENDTAVPAFSMPIGDMALRDAISLVFDYCRHHNLPVQFSAVPEDRLSDFYCLGPCRIEELTDWADYLYNAADLATLQGNKYSKKRNHVNRFIADNPDYDYRPLTIDNIEAVKEFYHRTTLQPDASQELADAEREQVFNVLDNYQRFPFEGAVLSTHRHGIVAFTIGEIIGDTLYVHIEKMNHTIPGAGETINKLFAADMTARHGIDYINREEDVGDEGLRKAKLSYHPVMLLKKYNLSIENPKA